MLPQSTVALRVSRSYSKVAYLKRSKSRIVHLLSSSSPTSLAPMRSDTVKTAIDREEISQGLFCCT